MNNTIITIVDQAIKNKIKVELIRDGYKGLINEWFIPADPVFLDNFVNRGNVVIGSARCLEFLKPEVQAKAAKILKQHKIDVLIVIGGDGSYNGAYKLSLLGAKVITLPGTIDNDIASTEYSIGFDTSLNQIVNSLDALKDSFGSHDGICFCEVMGRHYSDLAIRSCIANHCQAVVTIDNVKTAAQFAKIAQQAMANGVRGVMFIVTENIYGKNGLPSLEQIAKEVETITGNGMCRAVVLAHIQRGGTTVASDRFKSSLMGAYAITCVKNNQLNVAIGLKHDALITTPIDKAVTMPRKKHNFYFLEE